MVEPILPYYLWNPASNVDQRFNEQLTLHLFDALPSNKQFQLGFPSFSLLQAGFPSCPIQLGQSILKKADKAHAVPAMSLVNLPSLLQEPMMVFRSRHEANTLLVLTERLVNQGNLLLVVRFNANPKQSSIRTIYSKLPHQALGWIKDGLLVWADPFKAYDWLNAMYSSDSTEFIRYFQEIRERAKS